MYQKWHYPSVFYFFSQYFYPWYIKIGLLHGHDGVTLHLTCYTFDRMNSDNLYIEANSLQRQFVLYIGSIVSAYNLWVGLIWAWLICRIHSGGFREGVGDTSPPPPQCIFFFFFAFKIRKTD